MIALEVAEDNKLAQLGIFRPLRRIWHALISWDLSKQKRYRFDGVGQCPLIYGLVAINVVLKTVVG